MLYVIQYVINKYLIVHYSIIRENFVYIDFYKDNHDFFFTNEELLNYLVNGIQIKWERRTKTKRRRRKREKNHQQGVHKWFYSTYKPFLCFTLSLGLQVRLVRSQVTNLEHFGFYLRNMNLYRKKILTQNVCIHFKHIYFSF